MSGPIVRTGTTPKYGESWDRIFGGKAAKKTVGTKASSKTKATATKTAAAKTTTAKAKTAAGAKKSKKG